MQFWPVRGVLSLRYWSICNFEACPIVLPPWSHKRLQPQMSQDSFGSETPQDMVVISEIFSPTLKILYISGHVTLFYPFELAIISYNMLYSNYIGFFGLCRTDSRMLTQDTTFGSRFWVCSLCKIARLSCRLPLPVVSQVGPTNISWPSCTYSWPSCPPGQVLKIRSAVIALQQFQNQSKMSSFGGVFSGRWSKCGGVTLKLEFKWIWDAIRYTVFENTSVSAMQLPCIHTVISPTDSKVVRAQNDSGWYVCLFLTTHGISMKISHPIPG